jgi:hypothetical protein
MRILAVVTLVALAGVSAWAGDVEGRKVLVCTTMGDDFVVQRAESIAATMFAGIGVQIEWHRDRFCPADAIRISFADGPIRKFRPEALAYALPYEGSHIEVFYDRVQQHGPSLMPVLLAHVMVHEITHMLQGVCRHSESGVMMARWGTNELNKMAFQPLRFTDTDVQMIYKGLEARESRLAAR